MTVVPALSAVVDDAPALVLAPAAVVAAPATVVVAPATVVVGATTGCDASGGRFCSVGRKRSSAVWPTS